MIVTLPNSLATITLQWPRDLSVRITPDQFIDLVTANPDLQLERTAAGELIVNPPTGGETGHRNIKIAYYLVRWIEEQGGNGIAFDSSTGFTLPNGAIRFPDAAWITQQRWQTLTPLQRQSFVPLCPDFVIELRSESDNLAKLQAKLQEYLENGTQLGWLIDPQQQQVEIYRAGQAVEVMNNPTQLSGEKILPGFILNLQRIWS
ncbi:Uma2 family endonuclease [Oxynema aestuarii AP17]|uniref:Uma2 family endonuclease n=1 Tax=Oxynema aestuarii AP17 TaxID=2064643 RepID=A0A6H1U4Q8_9CYAN|nr:Uma2 family endonuclease [Oxynema aestuarii]QIZ73357.1 Uma2 family endonuclease [Oxynema aestuarii AP17]